MNRRPAATALVVVCLLAFASVAQSKGPKATSTGMSFPKPAPIVRTYSYTMPKPRVAENGSYYGQLNNNGVPKTVYIRSHFRSPAGSNPKK